MILNEFKTKILLFNCTKKYQFIKKFKVKEKNIEIPNEVKLLGTVITDNLKWDRNTEKLVKKGYKKMQILHSAAKCTSKKDVLKDIYISYIGSILEQSSVVWHSSLTNQNRIDLERVQKVAVRIIMGSRYESFAKSLKALNLETLEKRRETLCLKFAKNCLKNEKQAGAE